MTFNIHSTTLADISVNNITGRRGLGFAQLRFNFKFTFSQYTPLDVVVQDIRFQVDVARLEGGSPQFLGTAISESAWSFKTGKYVPQESGDFALTLTDGQLAALEEFREGDGLAFSFTASALATRSEERYPQFDQFHRRVNLSEWVPILKSLGGSEYFVVAVPLPIANNGQLTGAIKQLKRAHLDLLSGNYGACVAACRTALEVVRKQGPAEQIHGFPAVKRYIDGKQTMNRVERELLLEEAGTHYCHLAVHTSLDGSVELFSRDDAQLILTVASALVRAAQRRIFHSEPLQEPT